MTALAEQAAALRGSTTPRLWTRPLVTGRPGPCGCGCALDGRTSRGFEAVMFAERVLGVELIPWQRWWLIHAFELRPDGRNRYRTILTLVGRQQGKTTLLKIVSLWLMFLGHARLILGSAQSLDIALESWQGAVDLVDSVPDLAAEVAEVCRTNGRTALKLASGARYRITAATRSAGRGLSVDCLILDELREHRDWSAWSALSKTTMARPDAVIVGISNAGDDESVVLNSLRAGALAAASAGEVGSIDAPALFEWSAPDGCALDDTSAWCQSMPGLGWGTITESAVRSALATDPAEVFRTELLCQHVSSLDSAFDPAAWTACADRALTLVHVRGRVVLALDVAPDGRHVTAALAAPLGDGGEADRYGVEIAGAWPSTAAALRALPALVAAIAPRAIGWFPAGPGAVLTADLERLYTYPDGRKPTRDSPDLLPVQGADVTAACQGLDDLVTTRRLRHPSDPLLDSQAVSAQRKDMGDGFRYIRIGAAHVDAIYAGAGALHIARTLPAPRGRPMVY